MKDLMRSLGVALFSFLITGGLLAWFAPASLLPIGNAFTGMIVLAVLIAVVIGFFISIPMVGVALGAFVGSLVSLYFGSMFAPITFTFGIEFAVLALFFSVIFDWLAHSMMK